MGTAALNYDMNAGGARHISESLAGKREDERTRARMELSHPYWSATSRSL